MTQAGDSTGRVVRDALLLGVLLFGLNFVLGRVDAGWVNLNPTPWLLLPLLIGARYGVTPGAATGLLTALGLSVVRSRLDGIEPWTFATGQRHLLTGLVLGGFLAGQLNQLLRGDSGRLLRDCDQLKDQVMRLRCELGLVNETRHELQQRLALHNAPFACLDTDLRKLISLPPDEILGALLQLLHRLAGVTSAGFYALEGRTLLRQAVIHPTAPLAESIPLAQSPLAARALEENSIASLAQPMDGSRSQPFLTAIPWTYQEHKGVLLIQDMPLEFFEWRNLARIEVILHWALTMRRHAELFGRGAAAQRLLPLEDFMMLIAEALETEQSHGLPSTALRFEFAEADRADLGDGRQLTSALPISAMTTRTPDGGFASLLPFTSAEGAETIAKSIKEQHPSLRVTHHLIVGPSTLEEIWTRILEP